MTSKSFSTTVTVHRDVRNGRAQIPLADMFTRLAVGHWLRSEWSRHKQLSYSQGYRLRKHVHKLAALNVVSTNRRDRSVIVVRVPSVSAMSLEGTQRVTQHSSCSWFDEEVVAPMGLIRLIYLCKGKGKVIPLQARCGPEGG